MSYDYDGSAYVKELEACGRELRDEVDTLRAENARLRQDLETAVGLLLDVSDAAWDVDLGNLSDRIAAFLATVDKEANRG